jgi:predicted nucleic acid-binding protein
MKLLFDTNVVLDVLLNRHPWVTDSKALWEANDAGLVTGYLAASVLTDIFYIARRLTNIEKADSAVRLCLVAFEICSVDRHILELALTFSGKDFEDKVQIACAKINELVIVTRNVSDYRGSPVIVLTPSQVLKRLAER